MIKKLHSLLFLLLAFSLNSFAQNNHLLIMGGGGEPKRDYTIFDNEIDSLGDFVGQAKDWRASISFNGGHSKTESILERKFSTQGAKNTNFTPEKYNELIKDYVNKIKNNEIKSGDQLMVFINSHGSAGNDKYKTHSIATSKEVVTDFNNLNGGTVPLDDLEELTELAKEKNIKLALIDFSCHSGTTMALKNPNTCIITSTGPDHYGYGGTQSTFTATFAKNMEKGKSLEDVYLESRKSYRDSSFPMISSPIGLELHQEMYRPITPFLFYYSPKNDKFTPFISGEVNSENPYCINGEGLRVLEQLSREAERFMDSSLKASLKDKDFKKFNSAVLEYHSDLKDLHDKLSKMGVGKFKEREEFCTEYLKTSTLRGKECVTYTVQNIFTLDFDKISGHFRTEAQKAKGIDKKIYEAMLTNFEKVKARKAELMSEYPELVNYKDFNEMMPELENKTRQLAGKVSTESQKLYYALYKQRSSKSTASNPCKDFVL